jgi:hypothetical protein
MLYVYIFLLIGTQVCLSGLSNFLPTLVKTIGYTAVQAQLMTVSVYVVAFFALSSSLRCPITLSHAVLG